MDISQVNKQQYFFDQYYRKVINFIFGNNILKKLNNSVSVRNDTYTNNIVDFKINGTTILSKNIEPRSSQVIEVTSIDNTVDTIAFKLS